MKITLRQKKTLDKHKKHHSRKHIKEMIANMVKGTTFKKAHNIAMKKVGK